MTTKPAPPRGEKREEVRRLPAVVAFLILLAVVLTGVTISSDFTPADRDLIDTDGYMRYVRIAQLHESGSWFDASIVRSNAPFGEQLHWTRPLDIFVLVLAFLLSPLAGDDALYWAAVVNAPLLLLSLGVALHWAFSRFFESENRALLMFGVVAIPLVLSYSLPGRVDHHILILLLFVGSVGFLLRVVTDPERTSAPFPLGIVLAIGLWTSTEFMVPWFLVGITLALFGALEKDGEAWLNGFKTMATATGATAVAVVLERGGAWSAVEFDKVSIVHVTVAAAATVTFAVARLGAGLPAHHRIVSLLTLAALLGAVVVALFPDLVGGPFVDVDPRVQQIWLHNVTELHPITAQEPSTVLTVLGPSLLGLAIAFAEPIMRGRTPPEWWLITGAWLFVYTVLSAYQTRWAIFAHVLALVFLVRLIEVFFGWMPRSRARTVLRPLVVAAVFGVAVGSGLAARSVSAEGDASVETSICDIDQISSRISDGAVVLADLDDGPELLYRTDGRVIATPYHRNASGILFLRDVMAERSFRDAQAMLQDRQVDLILVCPSRSDFMRPPDNSATFYSALTSGDLPAFVEPVELPAGTGYRLFAVRS